MRSPKKKTIYLVIPCSFFVNTKSLDQTTAHLFCNRSLSRKFATLYSTHAVHRQSRQRPEQVPTVIDVLVTWATLEQRRFLPFRREIALRQMGSTDSTS